MHTGQIAGDRAHSGLTVQPGGRVGDGRPAASWQAASGRPVGGWQAASQHNENRKVKKVTSGLLAEDENFPLNVIRMVVYQHNIHCRLCNTTDNAY